MNKWFSSKNSEQSQETENLEWKIATSPSCSQLAILKSDEIFIRSTESTFQTSQLTNIGTTSVPIPYEELNLQITRNQIHKTPEKWRQLVWSLDEQIIAVLCGSTGPVFILSVLESEILQIIKPEDYSLHNGVSSIQFRNENKQMNGWELLILGFDGFLARLKISFDGMNVEQIYHEEGLFYAGKLHSGTTCMNYDIQTSQLIIGGGSVKSPTKTDRKLSVSIWKLLDEAPYHQLIYSTLSMKQKAFQRNQTFLGTMKHMYHSVAKQLVLKKVGFFCLFCFDANHFLCWNYFITMSNWSLFVG